MTDNGATTAACYPLALSSAPLSAQVVQSLRRRHANLLRPREPSTKHAAAAAGLDSEELVNDSSSATSPSKPAMPVRLVTSGVWPVASGQLLGSCCPTVHVSGSAGTPPAAAAAAERFPPRGRRTGDPSGTEEGDGDSAAQAERRSRQQIPSSGASERGGLDPEADVSAASVASEIAGLFDSVSVALNTVDPMQYEEVSGCS